MFNLCISESVSLICSSFSFSVTKRDIIVKKRQPEGQVQGQGRGSGRSGPGGNGYGRSFGGADGYQQNNGGRNDYQRNNRGSDGYRRNNGGGNAYHENTEGENDFQRNDGADAGNADGGDWQEQGQGHRRGGRGRGRGRGHGRGRGFNQSNEFGSENQNVVSNYQIEKQGLEGNDDGGWEQNEFQGKTQGSEAQYDERPRNVNRGFGGDRRGYGGGNRGFRGQEGRSYDRKDGMDNRRVELSNDSAVKENISGDMGSAVQVDNNSGGAEWYALSASNSYDLGSSCQCFYFCLFAKVLRSSFLCVLYIMEEVFFTSLFGYHFFFNLH